MAESIFLLVCSDWSWMKLFSEWGSNTIMLNNFFFFLFKQHALCTKSIHNNNNDAYKEQAEDQRHGTDEKGNCFVDIQNSSRFIHFMWYTIKIPKISWMYIFYSSLSLLIFIFVSHSQFRSTFSIARDWLRLNVHESL